MENIRDNRDYEDYADARASEAHEAHKEAGRYQRSSFARTSPYRSRANAQGHPTSGPEAGLKAKMDYWRDKDYKYEFGVSVGAAIGNAVASLPRGSSVLDIVNRAKELFSASLKLKKELRAEFDEYFSTL